MVSACLPCSESRLRPACSVGPSCRAGAPGSTRWRRGSGLRSGSLQSWAWPTAVGNCSRGFRPPSGGGHRGAWSAPTRSGVAAPASSAGRRRRAHAAASARRRGRRRGVRCRPAHRDEPRRAHLVRVGESVPHGARCGGRPPVDGERRARHRGRRGARQLPSGAADAGGGRRTTRPLGRRGLGHRLPLAQFAVGRDARGHGVRSFVYLFDWESPAFEGILGSCHALELPFVFGVVHEPAVQMFCGAGPEVDMLSRKCRPPGLPSPGTGSRRTTGSASGPPGTRSRATMLFGPHTGLVPHLATASSPYWSGTGRSWRASKRPPSSRDGGGGSECRYGDCCASTPVDRSAEYRDAVEYFLERDADLQTCQMRAEAEVHAVPE